MVGRTALEKTFKVCRYSTHLISELRLRYDVVRVRAEVERVRDGVGCAKESIFFKEIRLIATPRGCERGTFFKYKSWPIASLLITTPFSMRGCCCFDNCNHVWSDVPNRNIEHCGAINGKFSIFASITHSKQ